MIKNNDKNLIIESLKQEDINISDIYIKNQKMEKEDVNILNDFFNKFFKDIDTSQTNISEEIPKVYVTHKNKNGKEFSIPLDNDSSGTQEIINNIAKIFYINSKGGIILEDELGKYYHTKLTQHLINLCK